MDRDKKRLITQKKRTISHEKRRSISVFTQMPNMNPVNYFAIYKLQTIPSSRSVTQLQIGSYRCWTNTLEFGQSDVQMIQILNLSRDFWLKLDYTDEEEVEYMVSFEISQKSGLLPLFVYAAAVICKFPLLKIPDWCLPLFFSTVPGGILLLMKPNGNTTVAVELYLCCKYVSGSMTVMFSDLFSAKSC